jgi:hypothetical protein
MNHQINKSEDKSTESVNDPSVNKCYFHYCCNISNKLLIMLQKNAHCGLKMIFTHKGFLGRQVKEDEMAGHLVDKG